MKQRIFSHFQDYLIQYISHQYQDLLYCNSSQYILSTYNSQHNNNNNNNNNNVVLAMTMPLLTQHYYINRLQILLSVIDKTKGCRRTTIKTILFI